jgi:hypothetical protein
MFYVCLCNILLYIIILNHYRLFLILNCVILHLSAFTYVRPTIWLLLSISMCPPLTLAIFIYLHLYIYIYVIILWFIFVSFFFLILNITSLLFESEYNTNYAKFVSVYDVMLIKLSTPTTRVLLTYYIRKIIIIILCCPREL